METDSIAIRTASVADAPLISRLVREAFRTSAGHFGLTPENAPTHPSNCTVEWIIGDIQRGISYYILEANHQGVGCVAMEKAVPDHWYLERLAVLPAFQGRGHGTALVQHVISLAKRGGAKYLSIGIIAEDTGLKDWYLKRDFAEGQTKKFAHLPFRVLFMIYNL